MGRKAIGRQSKLIRVPLRFEPQVRELLASLKREEQREILQKLAAKRAGHEDMWQSFIIRFEDEEPLNSDRLYLDEPRSIHDW